MGDAVALVSAAVPRTAAGPTLVGESENAAAIHRGWSDFYRQEYPRLARAMFAYTGDREVAGELAQEAMARAWGQWSRIVQFDNPGAWTCRVAMNLANSRWRRVLLSRRITVHRRNEEAVAEADVGLTVAVRQAVAALPPRQRAAVVWRYFVDLPVADVARLMGCQPGTVTALTGQAIAKLRHCAGLNEDEGEGAS